MLKEIGSNIVFTITGPALAQTFWVRFRYCCPEAFAFFVDCFELEVFLLSVVADASPRRAQWFEAQCDIPKNNASSLAPGGAVSTKVNGSLLDGLSLKQLFEGWLQPQEGSVMVFEASRDPMPQRKCHNASTEAGKFVAQLHFCLVCGAEVG